MLLLRPVLLLCVVLWVSGCQLGYYGHLAHGHFSLMRQAQPVSELLADQQLDAGLRQRLELARSVLAFAEQELDLQAGGAYQDYVALEQDWVVWNLVAAGEFSLAPRQWCYPVVGCASYRGFFNPDRAQRLRQSLKDEGFEVYGSGAIAYSTLGWFDDPLTSAMLQGSPGWVAELLIHELVHQRLYVKGDTRFNESLATAVADEGRRRWLARHGTADSAAAWRQHERASARVSDWISAARAQLQTLYDSDLTEADKRARKAQILQTLRQDYEVALAGDSSLAPWQDWFAGPLNNAQLALRQDYTGAVPAFNRVLLECGGRLDCFWPRVEQLASLPEDQRQQWMEESSSD